MSPPHSVFVSKSTLLHTSLAYISPELETMDDIILNAYTQSIPGKIALPTELLLLIRGCLLPIITAQLIKRSTLALMTYEQSLRDLLCPDCISYNFDIYGPDIWQWEQFNGACACVEPVETSILAGSRNSIGLAKQSFPTYQEKTTSGPGILNPKQFVDASHWLESYLSREAALRVSSHEVDQLGSSGSRPIPTIDSIWNVVSLMLLDYGCEPLREHDDPIRSRTRLMQRQFHFQRDLVQIFPLQRVARSSLQVASQDERDWQAQDTLHRAVREMSLIFDYTNEFNAYGSHLIPPSYLIRWPSTSNGCYTGQDMVDLTKSLFHFLISLALACLSVPITFATLAVTILCFYSRPRGYRMF